MVVVYRPSVANSGIIRPRCFGVSSLVYGQAPIIPPISIVKHSEQRCSYPVSLSHGRGASSKYAIQGVTKPARPVNDCSNSVVLIDTLGKGFASRYPLLADDSFPSFFAVSSTRPLLPRFAFGRHAPPPRGPENHQAPLEEANERKTIDPSSPGFHRFTPSLPLLGLCPSALEVSTVAG